MNILENEDNKKEEDKIKAEDEKILAKILEPGENVDSQDSEGYTALHRAAKLGITLIYPAIGTENPTQTNKFLRLIRPCRRCACAH